MPRYKPDRPRSTNEVQITPFGLDGDTPQPADYDGDGKADPTVFRPETGDWYSLRTTEGLSGANWGTVGDRPVAGAYVR